MSTIAQYVPNIYPPEGTFDPTYDPASSGSGAIAPPLASATVIPLRSFLASLPGSATELGDLANLTTAGVPFYVRKLHVRAHYNNSGLAHITPKAESGVPAFEIELQTGDEYTFAPPDGGKFDLNDITAYITDGTGSVAGIYFL